MISFHVRSISPTCKLYIEISNHEEFREYFTGDPFKAYTCTTTVSGRSIEIVMHVLCTVSVSRFAVDSLREWTSNLSPITSNPNTPTVTPKAGPQVNPPDTSAMPPLSLNKPAASAAVPHPSRGDVDASAATAPGDTIELPLRQQSPLNNTSVHPAVSPMPKRTPSRTDPPITTSLIIGSDVCAREFVKFLVRERPFWNTIVVDEGLSEYFLADAVDSEVQELLPQMQSSVYTISQLILIKKNKTKIDRLIVESTGCPAKGHRTIRPYGSASFVHTGISVPCAAKSRNTQPINVGIRRSRCRQ